MAEILGGMDVITYFGGDKIPHQVRTVLTNGKATVKALVSKDTLAQWFHRIGETRTVSHDGLPSQEMKLVRIVIIAEMEEVVTIHYLFKK